ncbi:MAG: hypothetical protein JW786_08655 [Desulfobacterales bacterium]|nr:hypothetical protein [Desulfobacterales bacterium]
MEVHLVLQNVQSGFANEQKSGQAFWEKLGFFAFKKTPACQNKSIIFAKSGSFKTKEKMMGTKKTIGIIVLIIGVILLILSLAADVVRLGVSPNFGPIQIAGTVIGALIVVIGILLLRKKK